VTGNQSVFAVTVIAVALLVGAVMLDDNPRDADRTGDAASGLAPSASDQALFARNLVQLRLLNRLIPLQQLSNERIKRTISDRLRKRFPEQDPVDGAIVSAGRMVVSLVVANSDLNDPNFGLIPNNVKKGAVWERPGLLSVYRDQKLILRARTGVRIHGGYPGNTTPNSFRLYFRGAYGTPKEPMAAVIPGAPGPLRRLIINKTDPAFRNAIAFDISRRIGGIAPYSEAATFYLNGTLQGLRLLTEHISVDFLETRYGHRDFTLLRMKGGTRAGHGSRWQTLTERLRRQNQLHMSDAEAVIDMENLMRQYAAFLFCGSGDAFQGGIVRDDRRPTSRWFFANWDMEDSFRDELTADYFESLGYGPLAPPVLRPVLWRKLREDSEFKTRFSELMTSLLDTELTPEWFDATIARYRRLAAAHGVIDQGDLDQVEQFLRNQPNALRKVMAEFLASEAT
jgi:hypothetical protein